MNHKVLRQCPPASLFKQLLAILYDSLLIISILFLATAILLPFNQGEAVGGAFYNLYLLINIYIFYSWFWRKSGQTLGMKVWKIRIIDDYGYNPTWPISFLRLVSATFPPAVFLAVNKYFQLMQDNRHIILATSLVFILGYLLRLFRPYTLHDRISQTHIINISAIKPDQEEQEEQQTE